MLAVVRPTESVNGCAEDLALLALGIIVAPFCEYGAMILQDTDLLRQQLAAVTQHDDKRLRDDAAMWMGEVARLTDLRGKITPSQRGKI